MTRNAIEPAPKITVVQDYMPQSPGDGADEWRCESCIYYPPSSFGGKPCSYCWEGDPYLDQYVPGDVAEGGEE